MYYSPIHCFVYPHDKKKYQTAGLKKETKCAQANNSHQSSQCDVIKIIFDFTRDTYEMTVCVHSVVSVLEQKNCARRQYNNSKAETGAFLVQRALLPQH